MGQKLQHAKRLPVIQAANPTGFPALVGRDEQLWRKIHREDARRRQGGRCAYCDSEMALAETTADHVVPIRSGGTTRAGNIKAACQPCNRAKGHMTEQRFKKLVRTRPVHGTPWWIANAFVRLAINRMADAACKRIAKAAGVR